MARKEILGAFLAIAALCLAAAAPPAKKPPPAAKAAPAPDLNQPLNFPGGVMMSRDLVYASIDGFRPLTLDIYQIPPAQKATPRPAVLFVHDGDWVSGDARHATGFSDLPAALAGLSAKGYVVASVNYRLAREAHFPAAVQDVKAALRWLTTHAGDYDIDTTRMMVWGIGAGGQIASLAGTSCGVNRFEPEADATSKAPLPTDCVEGVIVWDAPSDFSSWDADGGRAIKPGEPTHLGAYLGCEPADCAPGMVHGASPSSYLETQTPPFLIQQGADDKIVAEAQSRKLYDALQALHVPSELIVYPGTGGDFSAIRDKAMGDLEDFIAKTFPAPPPPAKPAAKPTQKARK